MEPLTTMALVAAFLAPVPLTRRPDWSLGSHVIKHPISTVGLNTNDLLIAPQVPTEFILMSASQNLSLDRRDLLTKEINAYESLKDGWDGGGSSHASSASVSAALQFVSRLPGGLPLPGAMMSSVGEVGFYWDFEGGYADISFSSDGAASFFSRTHEGQEYFQESLVVEAFTRDWFFQVLGAMAAPQTKTA